MMVPSENIVLYVARHGTTILNDQGRFRGDANPPLDTNGWRDANVLAHFFEPIDVSFIVCSDKQRAVSTAETIAKPKGIKVSPNHLLRSWQIGDFSGQLKNKENMDKLQQYIDDPSLTIPKGESLNDFGARVRPLFKEAIETGIELGMPGLLVVHSSTIHEIGTVFCNHHTEALVQPGGVVAVYIKNDRLHAEAIFKSMGPNPQLKEYI